MNNEPERPQSVIVDNPEPLPVSLASVAPTVLPSATAQNPPARATTTSEQDRGTLGQRRINLVWEGTQGTVALGLVGTACFALLRGVALPAEYWLLLGIVVNSYFTRTNHTKIGGVGGSDFR